MWESFKTIEQQTKHYTHTYTSKLKFRSGCFIENHVYILNSNWNYQLLCDIQYPFWALHVCPLCTSTHWARRTLPLANRHWTGNIVRFSRWFSSPGTSVTPRIACDCEGRVWLLGVKSCRDRTTKWKAWQVRKRQFRLHLGLTSKPWYRTSSDLNYNRE